MQLYHVGKDTLVNVVVINGGNQVVVNHDVRSRISHTFFEYEILCDRNGFKNGASNLSSDLLAKMAWMAQNGCTTFRLSPHNSAAFIGYDIGKRNEAALAIIPDHSLQETDES